MEIRSTRTGEVSSYSARVTYNGQRRSVRLKARERLLAEAEMRQIVEEIGLGVWTPPSKWVRPEVPSFGAFAMEWFARQCLEGGRNRVGLAPLQPGRTALGARSSPRALRIHGDRRDHDRSRRSLSPRQGQPGQALGQLVNKTLTALAAILEMAVEYELIDRNPAKGRRRRLAATRPNRPWLDRAEQIIALLDGAGRLDREAQLRPGQRRALLATLVFAGLRLGEALSLRWQDVDLAAGVIRIRRAKTPTGIRDVNLLPILREELRAYKARHADEPDSLLFVTSTGHALDPTNVRRRILAPAIKDAEGKLRKKNLPPLPDGLTPHSLRRTFASLLFALGESPPYVTSQMGHTTPSLTLSIYAKEMHRRDGEPAKLRRLVEGSATVDEPTTSSTSTAGSAATFSAPWLGRARR